MSIMTMHYDAFDFFVEMLASDEEKDFITQLKDGDESVREIYADWLADRSRPKAEHAVRHSGLFRKQPPYPYLHVDDSFWLNS